MRIALNLLALTLVVVLTGGCASGPTEATFMEEFKRSYLNGDFPTLLAMTANESKSQFGEESILRCYEQMNFAYDMEYLSTIDRGDHKLLRYRSNLMGMSGVANVKVVREDGRLKVVLRSLDETWGRCIQDGI